MAMTYGFNDFDFLIGEWRVRHRRLRTLLSHCSSWQQFLGRSEARKVLGGFGVIDENVLFEPHGTYRSMVLRTFDAATHYWNMWHYDGRVPAQLEPPLVGKFEGRTGAFYGHCPVDGTSVQVRYLWVCCDDAPRLERAFTMNNGQSWETNWTMDFHKAS